MSENKATGHCLCKKVSFQITGNLGVFQYCHCSRCRKVTGSAHAANLFTKPEQFRWLSGEEFVEQYAPHNTKYFGTAFCKRCGSNMPWLAKTGKTMVVPAGSLDDDPQITPIQNIFWDSRACWYKSVDELPRYGELPPKK